MLDHVLRLLPRSRFWRRLTALAGATALGQGVMVLAMPLLTRIYTPRDFGAFVVFTMAVALLTFAMGLRYEAAIPLCSEDEDAATLGQLVALIALVLALLQLPLLAIAGGEIARLLGLGEQAGILWWLPLAFFLEGVGLACNGWAMYRGMIRALGFSRIAQWVTVAIAQVILGVLSHGAPEALLAGYVLGQLAAVLAVALLLEPARRRLFLTLRWRRMLQLGHRFRRFPLFGSWAMLLSNAAMLLPAILTTAVFGLAAGGLYGLAQRTLGIPVRFVGISAAQVYTAEVAELGPGNRPRIAALFGETVQRLFLLGAVYLGALALAGPWLFTILFGAAWRESGLLAGLLAPMYLANFIYQPIQYTIQFFERQDLILMVNAYALLVVLGAFWLGTQEVLGLKMTVLAMSLGLTLSYLLSFLLARQLVLGRLRAGRADADIGG